MADAAAAQQLRGGKIDGIGHAGATKRLIGLPCGGKVAEAKLAVSGHQDIAWLQVAVQMPLVLKGSQGGADIQSQVDDIRLCQRLSGRIGGKTFQPFHAEKNLIAALRRRKNQRFGIGNEVAVAPEAAVKRSLPLDRLNDPFIKRPGPVALDGGDRHLFDGGLPLLSALHADNAVDPASGALPNQPGNVPNSP